MTAIVSFLDNVAANGFYGVAPIHFEMYDINNSTINFDIDFGDDSTLEEFHEYLLDNFYNCEINCCNNTFEIHEFYDFDDYGEDSDDYGGHVSNINDYDDDLYEWDEIF